jgi:hypothetical protein
MAPIPDFESIRRTLYSDPIGDVLSPDIEVRGVVASLVGRVADSDKGLEFADSSTLSPTKTTNALVVPSIAARTASAAGDSGGPPGEDLWLGLPNILPTLSISISIDLPLTSLLFGNGGNTGGGGATTTSPANGGGGGGGGERLVSLGLLGLWAEALVISQQVRRPLRPRLRV